MIDSATTSMMAKVPLTPPRQQHEHQHHRDEARRHQDLEIAQRHFHEGLVEDHLTGDPHVDAGEAIASPAGEPVRGLGYPGPFEHLVLAGQLDDDIDAADPAVAGEEVSRKARLGEGDRANSGTFLVVREGWFAHQIADQEVVAVGRGVLEVDKRVDPRRVRKLPGLPGEPGSGFERQRRGRVVVVRDYGEQDVVVRPVRVVHCLVREKLGVVLVEVDEVVRREPEKDRAACRGAGHDHRRGDDRPPPRDDPAANPRL